MPPTFAEILQKLRELKIAENFDMIVAIANGGILPAALLHEKTQLPVQLLHINFRDEKNQPRAMAPVLLQKPNFEFSGKKIILADDRIKTGATIQFAKQILAGAADIKTFAINGTANYALFNQNCFPMPWRI